MRQVLEGHPNGKAWASSVLRVQKLGQQRRSTSKHVLTGYMLSWYKGMGRDSTVILHVVPAQDCHYRQQTATTTGQGGRGHTNLARVPPGPWPEEVTELFK